MYFSSHISTPIPISPFFHKLFLEGACFNSFVIYSGGRLRGKPSLAKGAYHHDSPDVIVQGHYGNVIKGYKVL